LSDVGWVRGGHRGDDRVAIEWRQERRGNSGPRGSSIDASA
jgi:hypothetical protein